MADSFELARPALDSLRRRFEDAAGKHGPLRCMIVHHEGADFDRRIPPPRGDGMECCAALRSYLYSYVVSLPDADGKPSLWGPQIVEDVSERRRGTVGTGPRPEVSAGRDVYLLRVRPGMSTVTIPDDPSKCHLFPEAEELLRLSCESAAVFWHLAGEAGACFRGNYAPLLPRVARESVERTEDDLRWLWLLFDLAWRNEIGSPLQAERRVWWDCENGDHRRVKYDLDFLKELQELRRERTGQTSEGQGRRQTYPEEWLEHPPQFFYSELPDVFAASVYAIDQLLAELVPDAPDSSPGHRPSLAFVFRKEGDTWTVAFEGESVTGIKDQKGMLYIQKLLGKREQHVRPEALEEAPDPADVRHVTAAEAVGEEGDSRPRRNGGVRVDAVHDKEGLAKLRRDYGEAQAERDRAIKDNDGAAKERAERDIESLFGHLQEGGRASFANAAGKCRERVSKALGRAIEHIESHHVALGRHLKQFLSVPNLVYTPDRHIDWQF